MQLSHRLIRTTLLAAAMGFAVSAAPAHAQVNVTIDLAPPAPRYEVVPQVRRGYVWAPGHWAYRNRGYVWVSGRQIVARPGERWVADYYEPGNRYHAGHWEREERRAERHEEHEQHGHQHGHGDHFCPPGQAKKGNC